MGLDIYVATQIGDRIDTEGWDEGKMDDLYDDPNVVSLYQQYEPMGQGDGFVPGFYKCGKRRTTSFRAGSYGGYNYWRNALAEFGAGVAADVIWDEAYFDEHKDKPFVELINFSDCEGFIGPKTSAKLSKDFEKHKEAANENEALYGYSEMVYDEWAAAFKLAAETHGVVVFA